MRWSVRVVCVWCACGARAIVAQQAGAVRVRTDHGDGEARDQHAERARLARQRLDAGEQHDGRDEEVRADVDDRERRGGHHAQREDLRQEAHAAEAGGGEDPELRLDRGDRDEIVQLAVGNRPRHHKGHPASSGKGWGG